MTAIFTDLPLKISKSTWKGSPVITTLLCGELSILYQQERVQIAGNAMRSRWSIMETSVVTSSRNSGASVAATKLAGLMVVQELIQNVTNEIY